MPPAPSPIFLALIVTLAAVFSATVSAWVWALVRLAQGRELVPQAKPHRVPWDAWAIPVVVVLQLILSFAVGQIHRAITGRSGMPSRITAVDAAGSDVPAPAVAPPADEPGRKPRTYQDLLEIQAIVYLLTVVLVPVILRELWGARLADLGLGRRGLGRNLIRGAVGFLLVTPVCYVILLAFQRISSDQGQPHPLVLMLRQDFTLRTVALAALAGVVLAPLAEELLFRGVVLGGLERLIGESGPPPDPWEESDPRPRRYARSTLPNVLTSGLFAGLHYAQWPAPVPLFVLSMALGWLRQRTGSLWPPVVLHACFNGLSTAVLVLSLAAGVHPDGSSPFGSIPTGMGMPSYHP